jgi:hypothetical protein
LSSISSSETSSSSEDHARNPDKLPPPSFSNQSNKNYPSFKEMLEDFMPMERINLKMESTNIQVISKEESVCVVPTDKAKVYETFIKGINNKLRGADTILGMGKITTIAKVISFSQLQVELQKHITNISAHSVFYILGFSSGILIDPDSPEGRPTNLLSTSILPLPFEIEGLTLFYS